jgi:dihydroxyacetone kinase-like protein
MAMTITSGDYVDYIERAAKKIAEEGDYITRLDAETGDGDHWANINSGFTKLVSISGELRGLPLGDMFKKTGMTLMSAVGGSSGVLYGSAYIAAAKCAAGKECLDLAGLAEMLGAMLDAIVKRGNAEPGQKTMIDALHPAVKALNEGMASGCSDAEALDAMKRAAIAGAKSTKDMEALRGRACYQADKGKGHLDPGAVTMCYQIETLANFIMEKLH